MGAIKNRIGVTGEDGFVLFEVVVLEDLQIGGIIFHQSNVF